MTTFIQGQEIIFTNNSKETEIHLKPGKNKTLHFHGNFEAPTGSTDDLTETAKELVNSRISKNTIGKKTLLTTMSSEINDISINKFPEILTYQPLLAVVSNDEYRTFNKKFEYIESFPAIRKETEKNYVSLYGTAENIRLYRSDETSKRHNFDNTIKLFGPDVNAASYQYFVEIQGGRHSGVLRNIGQLGGSGIYCRTVLTDGYVSKKTFSIGLKYGSTFDRNVCVIENSGKLSMFYYTPETDKLNIIRFIEGPFIRCECSDKYFIAQLGDTVQIFRADGSILEEFSVLGIQDFTIFGNKLAIAHESKLSLYTILETGTTLDFSETLGQIKVLDSIKDLIIYGNLSGEVYKLELSENMEDYETVELNKLSYNRETDRYKGVFEGDLLGLSSGFSQSSIIPLKEVSQTIQILPQTGTTINDFGSSVCINKNDNGGHYPLLAIGSSDRESVSSNVLGNIKVFDKDGIEIQTFESDVYDVSTGGSSMPSLNISSSIDYNKLFNNHTINSFTLPDPLVYDTRVWTYDDEIESYAGEQAIAVKNRATNTKGQMQIRYGYAEAKAELWTRATVEAAFTKLLTFDFTLFRADFSKNNVILYTDEAIDKIKFYTVQRSTTGATNGNVVGLTPLKEIDSVTGVALQEEFVACTDEYFVYCYAVLPTGWPNSMNIDVYDKFGKFLYKTVTNRINGIICGDGKLFTIGSSGLICYTIGRLQLFQDFVKPYDSSWINGYNRLNTEFYKSIDYWNNKIVVGFPDVNDATRGGFGKVFLIDTKDSNLKVETVTHSIKVNDNNDCIQIKTPSLEILTPEKTKITGSLDVSETVTSLNSVSTNSTITNCVVTGALACTNITGSKVTLDNGLRVDKPGADYTATAHIGDNLTGKADNEIDYQNNTHLFVCSQTLNIPLHVRTFTSVFNTTAILFSNKSQADGGPSGSIILNGNTVSYTSVSDYRLKRDVSSFPKDEALERIMNIKPVTYKWKNDQSEKLYEGFIAHELQEQFPQCVSYSKDDPNNYQSVDSSHLIPALVATIQRQQEQIDSLMERMKAIEEL